MTRMNTIVKKVGSIAVAASLLATSALADTTATTSVSTQSKSTLEKLREVVRAQLLVNYYGPGIGTFDDRTPESDGTRAQTANATIQNLENQLRLAAKIAPGTTLGITNTILVDTVRQHTTDLQAPFIHFFKANLYSNAGWNVGSDARIYLPMFRDTRPDLSTGVLGHSPNSWRYRVSPYANYTFGRWTAGVGTFARYNVRDGKFDPSNATDVLEVYAGPSLSYQVSPKVAVGILYEMNAQRAVNTRADGWQNTGTDLEPNVSIDITPNININPYINLYTGNSVNIDTMMLGFYLTATIL